MALTTPFAQNGDKKEIPQNTSDGSVSFDRGFGSFYALPPEEGGLFIDRAQFNQLMYDTTSQVLENKQALSNLSGSTYNKTEVDNLLEIKADWNAVVKLTDDQTINGVKTFTSNITAPNITAMQNNLNTIFSSTSSPVKTQTTTKIITVGNGGNFQDLLSAINEAKKYTSRVEIKLVSNLQINNAFYLDGINGEHITINFQNYKIINTSSKTIQFLVRFSSIGQFYNLNLENISFTMGLCAKTNLTGNINLNNTLTTSWSTLNLVQSSVLCFGSNAVININDTSINHLILSQTGSIISISTNATINSTKNTGTLLGVFHGGIIALHGTVTINKPSSLNIYNTVINTPSPNGIIFDKTGRS